MKFPRRPLAALSLACAAATILAADPAPESAPPAPPNETLTPSITAGEVLTRIALLASDEWEGRESGTEGGRRTEDWVAAEMARFGLEPLSATSGSPFTEAPMTGRPVPEESWIEFGAAGASTRIGGKDGACPFAFGKPGDAAGPLVFAGYGISSPKDDYDDYAGLDVKGKVVLVLRHGPAEKDPKSPWGGGNARARMQEMAFASKAKRAADAGAAAILLVNDSNHKDEQLPVEAAGPASPIPVFAVLRSAANKLLAPTGRTIEEMQAEIDSDRKPRSKAIDGVDVRMHAVIAGTSARNVVFVRRGTDPALRDEAVLVCAHMDHVGRGFFGSVSRSAGQIHNGADDNASGTAALLEVAEAMAVGPETKRTLVFAAWCGEEKGLIGSEHFAEKPLWDLTKIACVVNMDMVGRYRADAADDEGLCVGGMPTALGVEPAVRRLADAQKLKITPTWEAWEQSDHASFYDKGVPSLFLTTALHEDYHRPSDKWWKVHAEPEARIARLVVDLTRELADSPTRPQFAKKPPRPMMGVRLADAEGKTGARLAVIIPGLPANAAGLQVEDVVTSFGGKKVESASALSKLIAASKPDDVVEIVYRRGAEERTTKVKITGR
jgi:hypothetical protein